MRLPWPFNRQQPDDHAPAPADVFAARPRGAQAWRDLPVLATSVGEPPLIAPTPPFRDDLAGAAPAPIALAPLTHGHGLDAPSGLARNIVTAVAPSPAAAAQDREARSALMPTRKRSRPEQSAEAGDSFDDAPPAVPAPTTVPATPSIPAPFSRLAPPTTASAAAPVSMVRADRPQALPPMPVGRVGPARVSSGVQRAPAAATPPSQETVVAPVAKAQPRPDAISAAPTTGERLTLGQSRRRGLGAPIDPTVLQVTESLAASKPVPADLSAATPLVLNTHPDVPSAPDLRESHTTSASEAPNISVAPSRSHASVAQPTVQSARSAPAPALAAPIRQRSAHSAALAQTSRPLVGTTPVRSSVQRAPIAVPASGTSAAKSAQAPARKSVPGSEPVRIHRGSAASSMAGALDARAFTHGGEIFLPDSHGPLTGHKAQSLLAHEMTHVAQQRKLGSSLPHEDSAVGRQLEAQAVAAESIHELPLAVPSDRSTGPTASEVPPLAPALPGSGFVGSQAAAPTSAPEHAQRASANDAKWKDPDDAFRAQLDSNEDYLFDRFERRLRYALIHERERGGTLIDAL